jgi:flavin-dependent dehydrogenase
MNTEICVVGGGPAGSVIALRLAELGHDVCVFEKAAFPRPHVGESLTPGVLPLLEMIGLRERVEEAGFLRPSRAFVDWGNEIRHDMPSPGPAGFQVDRGRFDKLLLDGAAEAGVRVLQPAAAQKPVHQAPNGWRIKANWNGQATHIDAKFLVQASGRLSLLPGRKRKCGQPTIALYAYWNGEAFEGPETRIEAGRRQWYWGAPLPDGSFNATVFVDPGHCRTHGRRLENVYFTLLDESRLLRSCLHVPIIRQPKACDATCYAAEDVVGEDWIRVGEASFSIDPLSSQGVQEALVTALQGSAVVHTMLARSGDADAAIQFYRQRQAEHVERHAHDEQLICYN